MDWNIKSKQGAYYFTISESVLLVLEYKVLNISFHACYKLLVSIVGNIVQDMTLTFIKSKSTLVMGSCINSWKARGFVALIL